MEGSDAKKDAATETLGAAVRRDGAAMLRFASAIAGPDGAAALVERTFADAFTARGTGDTAAFETPRLFGALRRRSSQLIEQRRRAAEAAPSAVELDDVRPTEREALLLRYVAGASLGDVALAAGVDEQTARTRLSRGLSFIARLQNDDAGEAALPAPEIAARRRAVEESLCDVLGGSAPEDVADFVAEDDVSRDLVHAAERAVAKLRAYDVPGGVDLDALERRVLASVSAAPASPEVAPAAAEPAVGSAPVVAAKKKDADDPAEDEGARRKRALVALGIAAGIGAAVLALHGRHDATRSASDPWSGTLTKVSRAFGGGVGVERCSPDRAACGRIEQGDDVPAGSTLRTDGQTRAVVELRDGTRVVLDRDTELAFDGAYSRRARLAHGSVVADVTRTGTTPSRVDLPVGFVETEGAKVSIVTGGSRADADVARGSVRLVDERERGVSVHGGEVGRLEGEGPPEVFPTASLGDRFGWTDRTFDERGHEERDIVGLGELGAKRPGEEHEKKGLVTLSSHSTRVHIVGNVARTEVEEVFTSSSDDVLEGVFRFPLPPDAKIERLALDVDGKIEEGAFVDRDRAQAIWRGAIVNAGAKKPVGDEIVWVPGPWRDPALLEWQRGGRFELRIYPIPRRASRKVLLSYTQVVPESGGTRRYVYPLPHDPAGSTRVGRFDVQVDVRGADGRKGIVARGYQLRQDALPDGGRSLAFSASGFVPSGDLAIEYSPEHDDREVTAWAYRPGPDEAAAPPSGTGDGAAYVAIALRPRLPRNLDAMERHFAIVVDASRSMYGERYHRAAALTERIVREMDPGDRVTVLACDATCRGAPSGLVAAGPEAARVVGAFLAGVTPEGASDVAGAIREGRRALGDVSRGAARVVYVGDGTPTVGAVGTGFIRREIEAAMPRDVGTVTAVAIGADADVSTLSVLADAGGGVLVPYVPGQSLGEAAFALLGSTYGTTLADVRLELPPGLTDVAPERHATLRAGGETMLYARMDAPSVTGTLTLRGTIAGAPFEQRYPLTVEATTSKGNAFVPRLWAAAKIDGFEQRADAASRAEAIALSGRFHVASRYTSLLVLESAAMMQAFGLAHDDRVALWTGETASESTSAEGEEAVLDADDGRGALGDDKAVNRLATGSGQAEARASANEYSDGPAAAPAKKEAYVPAPAPVASPKRATLFAPPPPATEAPAGALGGASSGTALAARDDELRSSYLPEPYLPRPAFGGRRYIPMRKVWERLGRIVVPAQIPDRATADAVLAAEREASGYEPSRESTRRLFTAYMLSGRLDAASAVAERWSAKDPLDPDALTARADVAASRGERDAAIRILGSVVDVRPGDHKAVFRLARLHRWSGSPDLACRYSLAAAEIRTTDAKLLAEAVRCARDLGSADVASDLLSLASDVTRRAAEASLDVRPADPSILSGDLRVEATWDGGDDLDVSFIAPDGARVSWLGAPTKAVITARDVGNTAREGLALRGGAPGDYVVEVTRPAGHRGTVRGCLAIFAAGARRDAAFVLDGTSARVALVKITTRARLVPL